MSYYAFGAAAHHPHHHKSHHHKGHHGHGHGHHHGGGGGGGGDQQQQQQQMPDMPPPLCAPFVGDEEQYKACILAQYGLEGLGAFAGGHGGGGHHGGGGGHHGGGGHRGGGGHGGGRRGGWGGGYWPSQIYVQGYCEQLLPYDVQAFQACIYQTYGIRL